jgi:phosphatidylinositol alpha-mannosyltransferase
MPGEESTGCALRSRVLLSIARRRTPPPAPRCSSSLQFISKYFPATYEIIPNGVDLEQFAGPRLAPFPKLRDGYVNILFVGRLEKRKGLIYLLKALNHVRQQFPSVRLIVAGAFDAEQLETCERFVRQAGLTEVVFKGFVSPEDKIRYYKSCDIFCAPSIGRESQGIVLLEAMAAGKPVVASSIEGYRTVLAEGDAGLLVPPGDETALAVALTRVMADDHYRARLAEAGRRRVQAYAWDRIARRILAYYEQALDTRRRVLPEAMHGRPAAQPAPLYLP